MQFFLAHRFIFSKDNIGYFNILSKISILGIILGIAILITVMSVMNGFEKEIKSRILGFTSHVTIFGSDMTSSENIKLLDNLVVLNKIEAYSYYIENESLISFNETSTGIYLRSMNPLQESKVSIIDENIIMGEYFSPGKNGIIIGIGTAKRLGVTIGDNLDIFTRFLINDQLIDYNESFKIIGIYDIGLYEYNNAYAYVSLDTLLSNSELSINNFPISLARIKLLDPLVAGEFTKNFNNKYTRMYAKDWTQSHQSLFLAINNEKRVMFIILILVIVIAAFNIVSSLLISIKNKEKEIAILISLGASKTQVVGIFLIQGIAFGAIGIIFGVLLGLLLSSNINEVIIFLEFIFNRTLMPPEIYHLSTIPSIVDLSDIKHIVIVSFILIVIMSLIPARKAASLKPVSIFKEKI
tara:strand:+ start:56 stop:1288 length:1233 start_codon:yes stop_codon:yes gene_type:complete